MSRKRFLLRQNKNSGTQSNRKRAAERSLKRQLSNAALKYKCSVASLQNCFVRLNRLHLDPKGKYQELQINDKFEVIRRPRVFSAFDGLSSGYVALQQMHINPHVYFSSEIDNYCKSIQRFNFGKKVVQLGDICSLDSSQLRDLAPIDLLFGGSPCDSFSKANPARKGLYDETGTGPLFFQFLRVHLYFQYYAYLHNKKYNWFFENVASMDLDIREEISKYLGCQPIKLCASKWTGMKRQRFFWTNLHVTEADIDILQSLNSGKKESLQQSLCGSGRKANIEVLPTFTSNLNNLIKGSVFPVQDKDSGPCYPFFSEIEKLMGLPVNFTAGPNTPLHIRKKVLAKTWDVHTVKSLLRPLTQNLALP